VDYNAGGRASRFQFFRSLFVGVSSQALISFPSAGAYFFGFEVGRKKTAQYFPQVDSLGGGIRSEFCWGSFSRDTFQFSQKPF
jgi:hypothetical protein